MHDKQRGFVLVIGLIILLVMTLTAVSSARNALIEERMTGIATDRAIGFQAAEAALRAGEYRLNRSDLPIVNLERGWFYAMEFTSNAPMPLWQQWEGMPEDAHWNTMAIVHQPQDKAAAASGQARSHYYIEKFPQVRIHGESLAADEAVGDRGLYRITARGVGPTSSTGTILQSTFSR